MVNKGSFEIDVHKHGSFKVSKHATCYKLGLIKGTSLVKYLQAICQDDIWVHSCDIKVVNQRQFFPGRSIPQTLQLKSFR